jgi:hypothetical protein
VVVNLVSLVRGTSVAVCFPAALSPVIQDLADRKKSGENRIKPLSNLG